MEYAIVGAIECDGSNCPAKIDNGRLRVHHATMNRGAHFVINGSRGAVNIAIFIVDILPSGPPDQVIA